MYGDSLVTVSALSAEKDVAHYGDIVVKFDSAITIGTARRRKDDRFSERDPVNTDIQETSEDQPEKERKNDYHDVRFHSDSFVYRAGLSGLGF